MFFIFFFYILNKMEDLDQVQLKVHVTQSQDKSVIQCFWCIFIYILFVSHYKCFKFNFIENIFFKKNINNLIIQSCSIFYTRNSIDGMCFITIIMVHVHSVLVLYFIKTQYHGSLSRYIYQ